MLLACWNTLKFHDPSDSLKFDNTTGGTVINATEQSEEVVQTATVSSSTSSDYSSFSSSDYSSSSDWGYDWSSGGSSSRGSSSGRAGGYASVDDFDFT